MESEKVDGIMIEALCCYCGELMNFRIPMCSFKQGGKFGKKSWIERAHCLDCEEEHNGEMKHPEGKIHYNKALKRVRLIASIERAKVRNLNRKKERKILFEREGCLYRDDLINLGKIIGKDDNFITVQKYAYSSPQRYNRQCVRE